VRTFLTVIVDRAAYSTKASGSMFQTWACRSWVPPSPNQRLVALVAPIVEPTSATTSRHVSGKSAAA